MLRKILVALLVSALAGSLLGVGALWWLWRGGLPKRHGSALIPGLGAPVIVRFSALGVPHILAASLPDAATAIGYLHANDRMAQLEIGRRYSSGRLAELFGDVAVASDRTFRALGFRRWARLQLTAASAETRSAMEGYARGINAWLAERAGDLPPELRVLGIEPETWTPEDSVYFLLQMGHELSFWQGRPEENRLRWLAAVGPERLAELMGVPGLEIPPGIVDAVAPGTAIPQPRGAGLPVGSNNWILGGSRTAAGTPLVVNDPHLPLSLPGLWYQVQVRSPGYEASGVTLPGFPFVVIGQGPDVAWGLTNVMLDDHDLFLERLNEDGTMVRRGEEWLPLEITQERIGRAGTSDEVLSVRYTDIGVLLEPDEARGLPPRSLAWTGAEPADPGAVLLRLARAVSVADLVGRLEEYAGPAQNLVAVDRHGGLLYTALGRAPGRRKGDGRLPAPAWDLDYGWDGLQRQATNPTVLTPAEDSFVTANNDLGLAGDRPGLPPFTADFLSDHRATRIDELLRAGTRWAPEQMPAIQTDVRSDYAIELIHRIDGDYRGAAGLALAALSSWDAEMTPLGVSALFAIFDRRLRDAVFGDEARKHRLEPLAWDLPQPLARDPLLRLLSGKLPPDWFDDVDTPLIEGRDEIVGGALAAAWQEVVARWGGDPTAWNYGSLHPLRLSNPLGAIPLIGAWLDRGPVPMPGSGTTVAAFGGRWIGDTQPVGYGPSLRWIGDPADPDRSLLVLPGGQSGHAADRHYDDQLESYLAGGAHAVLWSEEAIAAATRSTLTLNPSR